MFDCDGVLWNGECVVLGVLELLEWLVWVGKVVLFVSNNSWCVWFELVLCFVCFGFGGLCVE